MERWHKRVAVISGASSGIGATCAKLLVSAGVQVVGLARRTERLQELRQSLPEDQRKYFHHRTCDVSLKPQVANAFEWIEKELGGCDILINNAGILRDGLLIDMPIDDVSDVIQTNIMGSVYCTQSAIKSMRDRQMAGHLIFINSTAGVAGYKPNPADSSLNIYTPTKFALTAVHEVLRQELIGKQSKIKTTSISPGWVATEIVPDETKAQLGEVILQADDVAQAVLYALSTPPHAQVEQITLRAVGEYF
ncbi:farnesol dehydrogenase [Drosophila tropicalis]|uniref:farnesol dehydrogenase n=1 Tax=Drosophila tropicalis TaxID=46794 RepID=UPI0035ABFBBB